jgi:hypothetical protein
MNFRNWFRWTQPWSGEIFFLRSKLKQRFVIKPSAERLGRVFLKTEVERADLETVIVDMLDGQYSNPLRVVSFNTVERSSQD